MSMLGGMLSTGKWVVALGERMVGDIRPNGCNLEESGLSHRRCAVPTISLPPFHFLALLFGSNSQGQGFGELQIRD